MLTPTVLLTRPRAASERFLAELRAAGVALPAVVSPVMKIVPQPPDRPIAGSKFIFTSANGVETSEVTHGRAWVVGQYTAEVAERAGLKVEHVAEDASALVAHMLAVRPDGPFLHLRGAHARGDIVGRLASAGIEAEATVVYRQIGVDLAEAARALLRGAAPVILPLFSPRSARLLARQSGPPAAPCRIVAISPAVAEAWPYPAAAIVASAKTGAAMLDAVRAAAQG